MRPPSSPLATAALSPRRSAGVEALRGQGRAAVRTGRYADAVEAYSEAIALAPRDTALRLVRSQTYIKLKNFAAALDDATICTNLNPQLWKGWNCVAQAHMQLMSQKRRKSDATYSAVVVESSIVKGIEMSMPCTTMCLTAPMYQSVTNMLKGFGTALKGGHAHWALVRLRYQTCELLP